MARVWGRFNDVPRSFTGCVYVVLLTNGVVKVGRSNNPRTRLASLLYRVRTSMRAEFARYHVSQNLTQRASRVAEAEVLRRIERIGFSAGAGEFFNGVTFEQARQLCDQIARQYGAPTITERAG